MQALRKRQIKSGLTYDALFPPAIGENQTILVNAGVDDSVALIPKVVKNTLSQTSGIAQKLQGANLLETCKNIWEFVYGHIAYEKDQEGYEQIRSPARSWRDREMGVDCDCYTTFISSILSNLGIAHKLRITKYSRDYFQHIYPIVPTDGNHYITIDCVTDQFNYEVPFSEKKDYNMDLQYLNGFDGPDLYSSSNDFILNGGSGMGELGLFGRRKKKKQAAEGADAPIDPNAVPGSGVKKKRGLKKLFNFANKINPATVLLRNGLLASLKLNIGKVASRLRWSYISQNDAVKKGIDPAGYVKLVRVRQKLENIFYGAGGNPTNMRKAILKGKGNKDKAVLLGFGLGMLAPDFGVENLTIHTPLPQLLGLDIYNSENVDGMDGFEGLGDLGEPITMASVAAAAAVIAGIVKALKPIGDLFKGKKGGASDDFQEEAVASAENEVSDAAKSAPSIKPTFSAESSSSLPSSVAAPQPSSYTSSDSSAADSSMDLSEDISDTVGSNSKVAAMSAATAISPPNSSTDGTDKSGTFWQKNKKWLLPVSIGVGGITLIAIGVKMLKPHPGQSPHPMHGIPAKRKPYRKKPAKHKKRSPISLL